MDLLSYVPCLAIKAIKEVAVVAVIAVEEATRIVEVEAI